MRRIHHLTYLLLNGLELLVLCRKTNLNAAKTVAVLLVDLGPITNRGRRPTMGIIDWVVVKRRNHCLKQDSDKLLTFRTSTPLMGLENFKNRPD